MLKLYRAATFAAFFIVPVEGSAAPPASQLAIAAAIKADVGEIVAGINSKDIGRATKFDAPDLVSMESGREPSLGARADHDGLAMAFKYAPNWHLTLIDETVDVAKDGDMAIYRGTYAEDSVRDGVP
jgi:ketosteroid isomerase-like protein